MKAEGISLRRRQILIAGAVGIAAPTGAFALGTRSDSRAAVLLAPGDKILVSGRIADRAGNPMAGALVEFRGGASGTLRTARTDADGRFMLETRASGAAPYLNYRVTSSTGAIARERLRFSADGGSTPPRRDENGVWRTTFAVALA